MPTYNMANATERSAAIEASRSQLDEMIDDPFKPEDPDVRKLTRWIIALIQLLISYVNSAFYDFNMRLSDLEDDDDNEVPPTDNVSHTEPATSVSARSRRRCTKCHAKGHDESQCRTQDPAASRRRVAINQRKKKEAAQIRLTYPSPVDPRFYSYAPPPPAAVHPPADYAALVADANEFRRRNNQSTQDRRRARRSAAQRP